MKNDFNLYIDNEKKIKLSHKEQLNHTAIIGCKRLRDNDFFYSKLINEVLNMRDVGGTFFVSSKKDAFNIYSLAKKLKRRVIMLSPTLIPFKDDALDVENIDIIRNFLNYTNCIYNKYIVVFNIDYMNNKDLSIKFIELLFKIIKESIIDIEKTELQKHNIYFNDSYLYIDYVKDIFYHTREYNVGLFFFIRNCVNSLFENNLEILADNCLNKIILGSASQLDYNYFLKNEIQNVSKDSIFLLKDDSSVDTCVIEDIKELKKFFELSDKEIKNIQRSVFGKITRYEKKFNKLVNEDNTNNVEKKNETTTNILNGIEKDNKEKITKNKSNLSFIQTTGYPKDREELSMDILFDDEEIYDFEE